MKKFLTYCNIFETKALKDDYYEQEEGSYILGCDTNKEDMDRKEHDAMDEYFPTYYMDGSDDYWNFIDNPTCENLIKNPIHDMSSKGSFYSKICGSPIYDTSIEESMDLDTQENLSMEEEHSKPSHGHLESYHVELHKGISNEDIEKQCCEKTDMMQSVEYQSRLSTIIFTYRVSL